MPHLGPATSNPGQEMHTASQEIPHLSKDLGQHPQPPRPGWSRRTTLHRQEGAAKARETPVDGIRPIDPDWTAPSFRRPSMATDAAAPSNCLT